jgi:acetolactate synthase-1/2/3 large subunit
MQLVYEMGRTKDVRPILCLQENTVTGAADGYARMAGKPAFTLLHVGGGLAKPPGLAAVFNINGGTAAMSTALATRLVPWRPM